jgi:Acetyltransferases
MNIVTLSQLYDTQIKEISSLVNICNDFDNIILSFPTDSTINDTLNISPFYLLYINNELISILGINYINDEICESIGFTKPTHRQQGYFKLLLDKLYLELDILSNTDIVLYCPSNAYSSIKALNALGYNNWYSEYMLQLRYSQFTIKNHNYIQKQISHYPDFYIKEIELHSNKALYHAYINNITIGQCNIIINEDNLYIFSFEIYETMRNKGMGKLFLYKLFDYFKKTITLQVNSQNIAAYNLYINIGFECIDEQIYYI